LVQELVAEFGASPTDLPLRSDGLIDDIATRAPGGGSLRAWGATHGLLSG
jgi:hypothetical protein